MLPGFGGFLDFFILAGSRCPIFKNIQSQVGQDSKQHDLGEDVPAYGRGLD